MDRGAWRAAVHEVAESDMILQLHFLSFSALYVVIPFIFFFGKKKKKKSGCKIPTLTRLQMVF